MKKLIARLIINMISIHLAEYYIAGIHIGSLQGLMYASIVFGLVNFFVKPVIKFLTLPLTIFTLGLFSLVINGFTLLITSYFTPLFVNGLIAAIYGSTIISISNWFLSVLFLKGGIK